MKTIKLIPAFILFLTASIIVSGSNIYSKHTGEPDQQSTKSFKVNKGGKLYVNVNPGDIKISTWDKNEVVVKVQGLDSDELDNVDMYLNGNTVSVKYNPEWGWGDDAEFMISIPAQFSIEAKSSGGDIKLQSDLIGDVEISTMGGDVGAANIKGNAKLSTQGGDVKTGNIGGNLNLNTMGGDIRVGDISGEVAKVNTMGGDIKIGKVNSGISAVTYGGDISINGIGGNSDIETMGGNIDLRDVKGNVKMETKGGNLSVKNATGSIKANTYGGEIEMYGINGSVDARSMSGNISIELNPSAGSKSTITTQNGTIDLTLPSNAKANVSATVRTYGNWKYMSDEYSIDSDFPQTEKSNNDKKSISKEFSINGGGARIELKTTNGNISINKSR